MSTAILDQDTRTIVELYAPAEENSKFNAQLSQLVNSPAAPQAARELAGARLQRTTLTDYVTYMDVSELAGTPYGVAQLVFNMTHDELLKLFPGRPINTPLEGLKRVRKHIKTGVWCLIKIGEGETPIFFGPITNITHQVGFTMEGIPYVAVNVTVSHFMYYLTTRELRLSPVDGDKIKGAALLSDLLSTINPGAIAQYHDYNEGILQALKAGFSNTNPKKGEKPLTIAQYLQRVITAVAHYTMPFGGTLGDSIVVVDGGLKAMADIGYVGNEADVIKDGTPLSKYKAFSLTSMKHMDIINMIFNPLDQLIEIVPRIVPARTRVPASELTPAERELGVCLALIYRYIPATPGHGPTFAGYSRFIKSQSATQQDLKDKLPTKPTAAELFFGPTLGQVDANLAILDTSKVTAINLTLSDAKQVNAVFIEQPFFGDAHNSLILRANAPLIADANSINNTGLVCFSATHPFISNSTNKVARAAFYRRSCAAIAERVFHNIALNNNFYEGTIVTPYVEERFKPGMWLYIKPDRRSGLADITSEDSFICYIDGVSISQDIGDDGVPTKMMSITFIRGSWGVNMAVPTNMALDGVQPSTEQMRATETERTNIIAGWNT